MAATRSELALNRFLSQVARRPRLNHEQQALLASEAALGDEAALRALAESCLPLVVSLAAAQRGKGLRFHVLLATANRALMQSLRLDPGGLDALEARIGAALERAQEAAASRPPSRARTL